MAIPVTPVEILTDIADAIRAKEKPPTTAPIPVSSYAARIQALPTPPPTGWPNNRRIYRFQDFIPQVQQDEMELLRCDGRVVYENQYQEIFDLFKVDLIKLVGHIHGLPSESYDPLVLVGNKLYLGHNPYSVSGTSTTLYVIDTLTGVVSAITGLPVRKYNKFVVAGTKIYWFWVEQYNYTNVNSIVCIETTDDTFKLISVSNASYGPDFVLVGHRLFLGTRSTTTWIPFIDTNTDFVSYIYGLPSRTHGNLTVVGNKLYAFSASGAAGTTFAVVIDTTKIGTAESPVSQVTGFTRSDYYCAFFLAGQFLYVLGSNAGTQIIRIDTTNDVLKEIGPVPNRVYSQPIRAGIDFTVPARLVGNKVYFGSTTSGTSVLSINNNTAGNFREVVDLPNRAYVGFEPMGADKLYVRSDTGATTLVIIDTDADILHSQITGLPSRAYNRFFVQGALLWLPPGIAVVDTTNDTFVELTGTGSSIAVVVGSKLYLGSGAIVDLATKTTVDQIEGFSTTRMIFANDKLYVVPAVVSRSVLPNHPFPIYIKYGS